MIEILGWILLQTKELKDLCGHDRAAAPYDW